MLECWASGPHQARIFRSFEASVDGGVDLWLICGGVEELGVWVVVYILIFCRCSRISGRSSMRSCSAVCTALLALVCEVIVVVVALRMCLVEVLYSGAW